MRDEEYLIQKVLTRAFELLCKLGHEYANLLDLSADGDSLALARDEAGSQMKFSIPFPDIHVEIAIGQLPEFLFELINFNRRNFRARVVSSRVWKYKRGQSSRCGALPWSLPLYHWKVKHHVRI